jgi:hypothetical protein
VLGEKDVSFLRRDGQDEKEQLPMSKMTVHPATLKSAPTT